MSAFNPWTATIEEALQQSNAYESRGAVFKWSAAHELTTNKERIVSGDGYGVLQAVAQCAMNDLAMPDWLAMVYLRRFRAVNHCKVDSWDAEEAFGRPFPKGTQITANRRKRENRIKVINAVSQAISHNPDLVIDVAFWEEIGQHAGEGKTNAQKLHAEGVKAGWTQSPSDLKKNFS